MKNLLYFAVGAVVGSAATWYVVKTKYEQIAQEEIDSVKEVFSRRASERKDEEDVIKEEAPKDKKEVAEEATNKPSIIEYTSKLKEEGYVDYTKAATEEDDIPDEDNDLPEPEDTPYVITPDDFGSINKYDTVSLTYYEDDILTDDQDGIIYDIDDLVGKDFMNHFGEYDEDVVYIRNDLKMIDFEILRDYRTFQEVTGYMPREVEVR